MSDTAKYTKYSAVTRGLTLTVERAIRAERKLDEAVRLLERVNNTMQCLGCYDTDTDDFLAHKGESK